MSRISVFAALVFIVSVPPLEAQESGLLASMDEMRFVPPKEKGSASLVNGQVGKAIRFTFEADAPGTFFVSNIRGKPEWDRAQVSRSGQAALGQPRCLLDRPAQATLERRLQVRRHDRQSGDRRDAAPTKRLPRCRERSPCRPGGHRSLVRGGRQGRSKSSVRS